jgi:hypothetical protein
MGSRSHYDRFKLLAESLYSITRSVEFEKVTELLPYDQTVVSLYE